MLGFEVEDLEAVELAEVWWASTAEDPKLFSGVNLERLPDPLLGELEPTSLNAFVFVVVLHVEQVNALLLLRGDPFLENVYYFSFFLGRLSRVPATRDLAASQSFWDHVI